MGSSPLARGLQSRARPSPARSRIIPARAGFTTVTQGVSGYVKDHPRSRGVYLPTFSVLNNGYGSSPLARGLRHMASPDAPIRGIIPARAGFTTPIVLKPELFGDHPRSRGVYTIRDSLDLRHQGSSPLARGLPEDRMCNISTTRIIPARAGFTCYSGRPRARYGDHPRSRGVYHR